MAEADSIWVMNALSAMAGAALIVVVLVEGFETVVLPHIVFRRVRLTRFFYMGTWRVAYPVLAYFRSEHEDQSWLTALAAIMDTCAFIMSGMEGACKCQAELTFSMSLHAITDMSSVFHCPPEPPVDRLAPGELDRLRLKMLEKGFLGLPDAVELDRKLAKLCSRYEPYVQALAGRFHLAVPPWAGTAEPEK